MKYYLVLFLIYVVNTLAFGQGISVSPSRIFFKGEAGQTVSQAITFSNTSASALNFVASLKDWDRDSLGNKVYYPPGRQSASNATWLSLSESTIHLNPGETKRINLSIAIPNDPKSKQLTNSMLFFTQVKEQQGAIATGLNVNVVVEIGIQVYHLPAGLAGGELEFLAFEDKGFIDLGIEQRVRRMQVKVKNTGKINKDAYVRFELTNTETGEETPVKAVAMAMLPNAEQWIKIDLPGKLVTGHYLAIAILDAGSQYDLKIAEKEITY
ncbi:fimbrial biogenesis chaperone [Sphingobacterium siyangense]|uniref:hypothetical protein n=1 Tax=Sphingobacterium siyangense TaxID=459529 RepID=UPI000E730AA1|nr:hypothetical protein [Sphingobacterium siyangense]QRY58239.1 hypothetical protein JVX97_01830 [Sphingobacterium siyangense]